MIISLFFRGPDVFRRQGQGKTVVKPHADKSGLFYKVVVPMFTSPLMGFVGGFSFMVFLYFLLRKWHAAC